jgi:hypothetical protein
VSHRAFLSTSLALAALLASCGGGGGESTSGTPTPAQRADAARQTAENNALCSTTLLGDYYWEIGDQGGPLASGLRGGQVDASSPLLVASASKWPFAAYVVERLGGPGTYVPYLNFTSGYSNFSNVLCQSDGTLEQCMNGGIDAAEAAGGAFHYQGGHMQQLGILLGLGALRNDGLGDEVRSVLGADIALAYASPQPPGGLRMTPRAYSNFLRRLLVDSAAPLRLGAALGSHAVCTSAADGCNVAPDSENFLPEPFHYSLGHWVEDNPASTPGSNFAYSSAGAFGFYPWVDLDRRLYGMVARESLDITVRQGYASLQCGRLIRLAWKTGAAQ